MSCIFQGFCKKPLCNMACPNLVETSYLIERNGLEKNKAIYKDKSYVKLLPVLHNDDQLSVLIADNTINTSNLLTYTAICENWQGNRLHCSVYHLNFSSYIESVQRSWGYKESSDALEYEQIWLSSAKILIISNFDFVQFKDFQAQTMLNIIQNRTTNGLKTIVVAPKIKTLIGQGMFFSRMKSIFEGAIYK